MTPRRKRTSLAEAPNQVTPGTDAGHQCSALQDALAAPSPSSGARPDRPWNVGGNFYDLCAYVVESRERTSNVILVILSMQIAIVILATILLLVGPTFRTPAQLGYTAAGIGAVVPILSLIRTRLRRSRREHQDDISRREK